MVSLLCLGAALPALLLPPGQAGDGFLGRGRFGSKIVWLGRKTTLEGRLADGEQGPGSLAGKLVRACTTRSGIVPTTKALMRQVSLRQLGLPIIPRLPQSCKSV